MNTSESPFVNFEYIKEKFIQGEYDYVLVAQIGSNEQLKKLPNPLFLEEIKILDGYSDDMYDRLKRFLGRGSKPLIYTYRFRYKS